MGPSVVRVAHVLLWNLLSFMSRPWLSLAPNLTVGLVMCICGKRGWEAFVVHVLHRGGGRLFSS